MNAGAEALIQLLKFDAEDDMKIQQKLFMNSHPFVDLSNKMHTSFAAFVQKTSKAKIEGGGLYTGDKKEPETAAAH